MFQNAFPGRHAQLFDLLRLNEQLSETDQIPAKTNVAYVSRTDAAMFQELAMSSFREPRLGDTDPAMR